MKYQFSDDFLWGIATAATQVEGAAVEDGRGLSIWDVFCRIPGKIRDGAVTDVACDQYHLYEQDIKKMKEMGIKSYRFSFSWSRILPEGTGKINEQGIAYYKRMLACLKEHGIQANATIYHWDLPYALQLKGGFGNREIVKWYKEYVSVLFDHFGDDVDYWVTFNEPIALYVGYAKGSFAPGLKDEKYARQGLHNLMVCHGEAVKLFRERKFEHAKIGIVVDVWKHYPGRENNKKDMEMALYNNEIMGYGIFLHPLFLGGYSKELTQYMEEKNMYPKTEKNDFNIISSKLDFYGLNFYNGIYDYAEEKKEEKKFTGGNFQDKQESHPEAVCDVLCMLKEKYHVDIPIYITENGYGIAERSREEELNDDDRLEYIRAVLLWLNKAISDGADVRGYYAWSLMDNFEWTAGYSYRYGLQYTDYTTQERIMKKSGKWYCEVIKNGGFD